MRLGLGGSSESKEVIDELYDRRGPYEASISIISTWTDLRNSRAVLELARPNLTRDSRAISEIVALLRSAGGRTGIKNGR